VNFIYYAVFKDEAIIYDHSTLDFLNESHGRMGEDILLEDEIEGRKVTKIEFYGLSAMYNVRRILLPTHLTHINSYGLSNSTMLEYLYISQNVEYLGQSALEGCRSVRDIIVGTSVKTIGRGCFKGCEISSIYFEDMKDVILNTN